MRGPSAINTRFIAAKGKKPARVRASDGAGKSVTVLCAGHVATADEHRAACDALCDKMGWQCHMCAAPYGPHEIYWVFV